MLKKIIGFLLAASVIACVLTFSVTPTSATAQHYISFSNLSSQYAYLDLHLPFDTYHSGGPFTVSMEVRTIDVKAWEHPYTGVIEPEPTVATYVEGTVYGTTDPQSEGLLQGASSGKLNSSSRNWRSFSFTFQNVGFYTDKYREVPGNLLRTVFKQTVGTVYIRNLQIQDASGAVVYDMNTDPDLLALVSIMQASDIKECNLASVKSVNKETLWKEPAHDGLLGDHYADFYIGSGELPTVSITRPPRSTTPPTTTVTSTTITTTKITATTATTATTTVTTIPTTVPTTDTSGTTAATTESSVSTSLSTTISADTKVTEKDVKEPVDNKWVVILVGAAIILIAGGTAGLVIVRIKYRKN